MSSNLPRKYENGIVLKIKRFFSKLFNKKEKNEISENISSSTDARIDVKKEDMFSNVREASKRAHLEQEILNIIDYKPELLETLSVEQLKVINRNYDRIIEENDKKINKLKRELAS